MKLETVESGLDDSKQLKCVTSSVHSISNGVITRQGNEDTDKNIGGKVGKPSGNHYSVRINQISL